MAKQSPFNLSFPEALEVVMKEGGWVQGQNFKNGVVLMQNGGYGVNGLDYLHVHDFSVELGKNPKSDLILSTNLYNDKFRRLETAFDAKNKPHVNALTGLVVE